MYSKLLIIQHEYENKDFLSKLKYLTFKLFATVNEFREMATVFSILIMLMGFIQLVSVMSFNRDDEIDEFTSFKFVSVIINYMIYLQRVDIKTMITFLYIIYCFTLVIILCGIYCLYSISISQIHYYFPFTVLMYMFIFLDWVFFLPILVFLAQVQISHSLILGSINIVLIVFYIVLGMNCLNCLNCYNY